MKQLLQQVKMQSKKGLIGTIIIIIIIVFILVIGIRMIGGPVAEGFESLKNIGEGLIKPPDEYFSEDDYSFENIEFLNPKYYPDYDWATLRFNVIETNTKRPIAVDETDIKWVEEDGASKKINQFITAGNRYVLFLIDKGSSEMCVDTSKNIIRNFTNKYLPSESNVYVAIQGFGEYGVSNVEWTTDSSEALGQIEAINYANGGGHSLNALISAAGFLNTAGTQFQLEQEIAKAQAEHDDIKVAKLRAELEKLKFLRPPKGIVFLFVHGIWPASMADYNYRLGEIKALYKNDLIVYLVAYDPDYQNPNSIKDFKEDFLDPIRESRGENAKGHEINAYAMYNNHEEDRLEIYDLYNINRYEDDEYDTVDYLIRDLLLNMHKVRVIYSGEENEELENHNITIKFERGSYFGKGKAEFTY